MTETNEKATHFGCETIPEAEKAGRVQDVFTSVASRYDLMNDLMSAGIHRAWKASMVDWLAPRNGQRLIDVAGGTGDIALRFLRRAPMASAVVCDMNEGMLASGRRRAKAKRLADRLDWVVGDAMALPFDDGSFDLCTIGFGIRNVTRPTVALDEAFRVLRTGGRLMILEFSHVRHSGLRALYDAYSFNVIPAMGRLIVNDRASYRYLVESIRRFPDQDSFADMIRTAGFDRVKYRNLSMGVVVLHSGWKL